MLKTIRNNANVSDLIGMTRNIIRYHIQSKRHNKTFHLKKVHPQYASTKPILNVWQKIYHFSKYYLYIFLLYLTYSRYGGSRDKKLGFL